MARPTFSRLHIAKGERTDVTQRLRERLLHFLGDLGGWPIEQAVRKLAIETGAPVSGIISLNDYIRNCSIADFLDSISHIYDGLPSVHQNVSHSMGRYPRKEWLAFATRAFDEEHVGYRVQPDASVTYYIDEEFENMRLAAVSALEAAGYETALRHLNDALENLKAPDTGASAIDNIFKATENVYKILSGESNLKKKECQTYFTKALTNGLQQPEKTAVDLMLQSLGAWIASCHQYRHADNNIEPTPPSREHTVWVVSSGLGHLRWMVSVRQKLKDY